MSDRDPDDRDLIAFGLQMMRLELERKQAEVALAREADEVLDALEADRAVIVGEGWGTDAYLEDLRQRIDTAVAFPATPWWRPDGST